MKELYMLVIGAIFTQEVSRLTNRKTYMNVTIANISQQN